MSLPPLPSGVRSLSNEEVDRLEALYPDLPRPSQCITCDGAKAFKWWHCEDDGARTIALYDCPCLDQRKLHRFLLNSGIGLTYQRLGWDDLVVENSAIDWVKGDYLANCDAYVKNGVGIILRGDRGTGKTLLGTLLLRSLLARGHDGYFTTFGEMVSMFMSTFRDRDEQQWFHRRVRNAGVLVLDDPGRERKQRRWVGSEAADTLGIKSGQHEFSSATTEALFEEVLRARVASSRPTIIMTNLSIEDMTTLYGEHLVSLLRERAVVQRCEGDDFRDHARMRIDEEVRSGLQRPVMIA